MKYFNINGDTDTSEKTAVIALRHLLNFAFSTGQYVYCDTPEVSLRIIDVRFHKGELQVKTIGKGIWESAPHNVFSCR